MGAMKRLGYSLPLSILSVAAAPGPGPLTSDVNVFTGTAQNDNPGNVFAGAAVPFGHVKATIQVAGYSPAGYVSESTELMSGVSPLHDSGTGSYYGSYGQFSNMPVVCNDFTTCPILLEPRSQGRVGNGADDQGYPGYFSTPLNSGVRIELTSTQAASLERYTFPDGVNPTLVLDWTDDSRRSFVEGELNADWQTQRITMAGTWRSSFGNTTAFSYPAFQCVDLSLPGKFTDHALWRGNDSGVEQRQYTDDATSMVLPQDGDDTDPTTIQAGAIVRWDVGPNGNNTILVRRGISFTSTERACENLEREIPEPDFDALVAASNSAWEDKLSRITLADGVDDSIKKLLYTSFYRTFLSPNNATGNAPPPFTDSGHPYFDGLYCSWDTFRTLHPLMALTSPHDWAQIVDTYVDGFRRDGWLPECRANNVKGWVQGGNNGVPIVSDFLVKYSAHADALGVDLTDYWPALDHDINVQSPFWDWEGRRSETYNKVGWIAAEYNDTIGVGWKTREVSRGLEYAFGDHAAAMAARALGQPADIYEALFKRSLSYRTNYDPDLQSDGYSSFVTKRYLNGTFIPIDPATCSPLDPVYQNGNRACSLQPQNIWGVFESSSWEYSFYAPHDGAGLVELLGGNQTFGERLHHFFDAGYYSPGNEPSFQTPALFHHIGAPGDSVEKVRQVVYENFNLDLGGLPGNDDNAAMASLLSWYLLGFYPVPGTGEMLVLSPFMPGYTIHNTLLGDVQVTVTNFDERTLQANVTEGLRAYVDTVNLDGVSVGRCRIDFKQFFSSKVVEFVMTDVKKAGCDGQEPSSVSGAGFPSQQ